MNDTTVNKQWSNRPDDQRFLTVDDLYGSYQYPLAIGRKTGKITAKCKFASYDAGALKSRCVTSGRSGGTPPERYGAGGRTLPPRNWPPG